MSQPGNKPYPRITLDLRISALAFALVEYKGTLSAIKNCGMYSRIFYALA